LYYVKCVSTSFSDLDFYMKKSFKRNLTLGTELDGIIGTLFICSKVPIIVTLAHLSLYLVQPMQFAQKPIYTNMNMYIIYLYVYFHTSFTTTVIAVCPFDNWKENSKTKNIIAKKNIK